MARPIRNNNPTQLVTLITPDGMLDEIPAGALRLPPTVGFQSIGGELCNPTIGGVCIGVAAEACYLLEGIVYCVAGAISWPAVCITLVVVGGLTIYLCLKEGTAAEQFDEGAKAIDRQGEIEKEICRTLFGSPAGGAGTPETDWARDARLNTLANCLKSVADRVAEAIEALRQKLFSSGRGRGTIPSRDRGPLPIGQSRQ